MQKILAVLFVVFLVAACTKEEVSPRSYPRLITEGVTEIDNQGAMFSGVLTFAPDEVLDHGFLWSEYSSVLIGGSDKISLGKATGAGSFEAFCERGLDAGRTYYMRSYAKNKTHLVYGNIVKFVAKGSKPFVLKDFYPAIASWGDTVALIGENFSSLASSNTIKFNDVQAYLLGATKDTLRVLVPSSLGVEFSNVTVTRASIVSTIAKSFQLRVPVIESVTPSKADVNAKVTISGKYLASARTKVMFKGVELTYEYLSSTSIQLKIQASDPKGAGQLKVETGSGNLFVDFPFEIN